MNDTNSHPIVMPAEPREREIVFLLCLLAAIHVFIFSATFPFFNNVDEPQHFDLLVRYANGELPRHLDAYNAEASRYVILFATVEYFGQPDFQPPLWTLPMEKVAPILSSREADWSRFENQEAAQPPLYYALASLWWRSAKVLGFHDGPLLYSVRFLNMLVIGALVWLSYLTARLIFPENKFMRLGVPALLAFIPQTAFYSIQNDVLSPLCFGVAFLCLIKLMRAENPTVRLGIFTGLALAATFLTKMSNLPLLAVSAAAILFKAVQLAKAGKLRATLPALLALALCAGLPMVAWSAWCKHTFGDFTASEQKILFLGWTHKPFAEWWHHPIFTLSGLRTFLFDLVATFWRGEIVWHHQRLALPMVDVVWFTLSVLFGGIALLNILPHSKTTTAPQRQALWFGFYCFAAAVAFLGFLSIIYDFHNCIYPSRAYPYFTSGRLMLGALIPFLLLFVYGLDCVLKKLGAAAKLSVLGGFILFMLITEITIDWPIFPNAYNWFHM